MRKTLCATALVLALSASAYAGDVQSPPVIDPDDGLISLIAPPVSGEQPADGINHGDNGDGFATAVLTALNSVLALL